MVKVKFRYFLVRVEWYPEPISTEDAPAPSEGTVAPKQKQRKQKGAAAETPTALPPQSSEPLRNAILHSIRDMYGGFGAGCARRGFSVKHWMPEHSMGLVKAPRDSYRIVHAAITLVTRVDGKRAAIRVLHVGGTIRSCKEACVDIGSAFLSAVEAPAEEEKEDDDDEVEESGGGLGKEQAVAATEQQLNAV